MMKKKGFAKGPQQPKPRQAGERSEVMDRLVQTAVVGRDQRQAGYRDRSLRIHPLVCARCGRAFEPTNLMELTVHHKDHNHDNNPPDGSNWENLCIYCHDNEHSRQIEYHTRGGSMGGSDEIEVAKYNPFENLKDLLKERSS